MCAAATHSAFAGNLWFTVYTPKMQLNQEILQTGTSLIELLRITEPQNDLSWRGLRNIIEVQLLSLRRTSLRIPPCV